MQVERGNLGTIIEKKVVVMIDQDHVGTAAASSSNDGESKPPKWM